MEIQKLIWDWIYFTKLNIQSYDLRLYSNLIFNINSEISLATQNYPIWDTQHNLLIWKVNFFYVFVLKKKTINLKTSHKPINCQAKELEQNDYPQNMKMLYIKWRLFTKWIHLCIDLFCILVASTFLIVIVPCLSSSMS